MTPSLTVVVPLYNAQSTLAPLVDELLEVLPELTPDFEVVLVDDGSTDATVEVAQDLSLHFPQVLLLVHPARLGPQEALRSALRYSRGDALLVCRDDAEFDAHEIPKLWSQLAADGAVVGQWPKVRPTLGTVPRLPAKYGYAQHTLFPDVLLAPRRVLSGWQQRGERQDVVPFLKGRGFPIPSVALRSRRTRRGMAAIVAELERKMTAAGKGSAVAPASTLVHNSAAQPKRPSFLMSRLRAFTWGE